MTIKQKTAGLTHNSFNLAITEGGRLTMSSDIRNAKEERAFMRDEIFKYEKMTFDKDVQVKKFI